jgi:hypothetical protein
MIPGRRCMAFGLRRRFAPCDVLREYTSVARLAGPARRRSRYMTAFMERVLWWNALLMTPCESTSFTSESEQPFIRASLSICAASGFSPHPFSVFRS